MLLAATFQKLTASKLLPSTSTFISFTNEETECQGLLTTTIFLQGQLELCTFYVSARSKECAHEVIFGRNWMDKHKCLVDWDKQTINVTMNNQWVSLPPLKSIEQHVAKEVIATTSQAKVPRQP